MKSKNLRMELAQDTNWSNAPCTVTAPVTAAPVVAAPVIAALGPTNTGKTHRALVRMQEFESGMIGLPLRLLAREVYDKLTSTLERSQVALVTGEEKIVPPQPRYWVCTVEAMPIDVPVDFVAVDEIQLAAHPERGHVFTDRLLRARGRCETWFMGAATILPLLRELVPNAELHTHPRLSALSCQGSWTLGTLPPRSAVVAFSLKRVYELAEKFRARRGGAAIVLGALSPRARNAQVAMYQAGEVDYLIATDAIGLGLNLDVTRIAFAETRKFDGHRARPLSPAELGQIAGRAGRYQKNGNFGVLEPCPRLDPRTERAIEHHHFEDLQTLYFRNPHLDFSSPRELLCSLRQAPPHPDLRLVHQAEDTETLEQVLRRDDIKSAIQSESDLRSLFALCQIPDYRKLLVEQHAQLVAGLFFEIRQHGRIRSPWFARRIEPLRNHHGDVESLTSRIAFIRTWTFVANHAFWLEDARNWRTEAASIEDDLSDALHRALVERFVNKRRTIATAQPASPHPAQKGTFKDSLRALQQKLHVDTAAPDAFQLLCDASDAELSLDDSGTIRLGDRPVGRLRKGRHWLTPEVQLCLESELGRPGTALIGRVARAGEHRLRAYCRSTVDHTLGSLTNVTAHLGGAGRGLVYQLRETMGTVDVQQVHQQLQHLDDDERARLEEAGVCFGWRSVYLKSALNGRSLELRAALYRTHFGAWPLATSTSHRFWLRPSFTPSSRVRDSHLCRLGYRKVGALAVRADLLERVGRSGAHGDFPLGVRGICSQLGCKKKAARTVAEALALATKGP